MGSIGKDPRFDPDYGVLVDAREMEYTPIEGEIGVLEWALDYEKINYRRKVAVRTGMALHLFSDRESALQWIGGS